MVIALVVVCVIAILITALDKGLNTTPVSLVGLIGFIGVLIGLLMNTIQMLQMMHLLNSHLEAHIATKDPDALA